MPVAVENNGPDRKSAHHPAHSGVPVTGSGAKQNLVPPNIRYHPSITSQTGAKQNLVAANIRYHPSITLLTEGAAAPNRPRTGTKNTHRGRQGKNSSDKKNIATSIVTLTQNQGSHSSDRKKTTSSDVTLTPDKSHSSDRKKTTSSDVTLTPDKSHSSDSPASRRRCNDRDGAPPPGPEEVPVGVGVKVERGLVKRVEVLTRGQTENPAWFSWRKNRITASVAHRIAHCRFIQDPARHNPPASYLDSITGEGPNVQTRAMRWGVEREKVAVRKYQGLKSRALGRDVTVQECGLFIDPQRSWLAASPDGIVTDRQSGQWLLCLEVKCPYKHRERTVEEACEQDAAFCLTLEPRDAQRPMKPPVYHLKQDHSYYSQIQVQLAVTGLTQADLVVYTLRETAIVPVAFDPEWWAETVSKLETFYTDALLPHLRNKQLATTVEE